jgi:hypothetical protein
VPWVDNGFGLATIYIKPIIQANKIYISPLLIGGPCIALIWQLYGGYMGLIPFRELNINRL